MEESAEPAAETVSASPSVSPSASPSAVPAPEPLPESLRELVDTEVCVWVDGVELTGLMVSGTTLVDSRELSALWSWFQWQEHTDTDAAVFIVEDGETMTLDCTTVDGQDLLPEGYDGTGGIWFSGQEQECWVPIRWLSEQLDMTLIWNEEQSTVYAASPVDVASMALGIQTPVLMYHAVSDNLWGIAELFVSPENMRAQLEYLLENDYDPIFFSDLTHLEDYDRPVLLTFDDGYDDNYTELFPLLQEYNVKATVFVITGLLGQEHYLTEEQVREMSDSGLVDIQSHTVDHPDLDTLSREEQEYQMSQSRMELAAEYYTFGVDMNGGTWSTSLDTRYQVDRIYISRYRELSSFAASIA